MIFRFPRLVRTLSRRLAAPWRRQAEELQGANQTLQAEIAERIKVEADLRRSEARLARAQTVAHLGSWEMDLDDSGEALTHSLWWSDETFRIFGHAPEPSAARSWEYFRAGVHPDDLTTVLASFDEARTTGQAYVSEHRVVLPEGGEKIVREDAQVVRDERTGKPVKVVGTVQDITDFRRSEAALRDAERKYRSIFDNAMEGIFQNTPEGKFVSANPALARMLGFDSVEELFRERTDLEKQGYAEPTQRQEFQKRLEEQGFIANFEYEVKRKDGSIICVSENVRVVRDAAGKILYYEGTVQDISERKRVERLMIRREKELLELTAQLEKEQARLVSAQAVAKVGSWETDVATDEVIWSAETYRIFEVDPASFRPTHQKFLQLVHPEDRQVVHETFQESLSHGRPCALEHRLKMEDGRIKFIEERWRGILDESGQAVGAIGTAQDITERKRLQEHQQAKDEAERANLAKSEFLSRMSHELRTPLNSILGFGQILEISSIAQQEKESIQHILGAGRHLLNLVDEVLDISRIESGRLEMSVEQVPLTLLLREMLDIIRPLSEMNRIAVNGTALQENSDVHVAADCHRLKQVLLNLLSNAIKYNSPGGFAKVDWVPVAGDERVRIRVFDSGSDIAPELRSRLFTPFDRLGAEGRRIEGTGLGLALSKRLIETMGGSIGFEGRSPESHHEKYFWVELPRTASPLQRADEVRPRDGPSLPSQPLPEARTVLYIEDNLSNLHLVERLMTSFTEVKLLTAMQGSLGLDMASQHQPDLILLDVHLPDLPGWEVLVELRKSELTRDTPVVVISADATQRQIERMTHLGASAYLTKPLDVRQFLQVVGDYLRSVRTAPSS